MRQRFLALTCLSAMAALILWAGSSYTLPRMPDGHPDLRGTYDLATLTPMERLPGVSLVLTKEQAAAVEAAVAQAKAKADQPIQGNRTAPPKGAQCHSHGR